MNSLKDQLPSQDQDQVDRVVICYELALQGKPNLDDFLALANGYKPQLLVELLLRHLGHRLMEDDSARIEEYLTRYPELANDQRAKLALIQGEWELRKLSKDEATAEYGLRFPDCREALSELAQGLSGEPRSQSTFVPEEKSLGSTMQSEEGTGPYVPKANEALLEEDWLPRSHGPTRYRSLHLHRKGGLGQIFVAQDLELRRRVALKEIQEDYAHEEQYQKKFVHEAGITGNLEHPNIVPIYGMGAYADGRPYYAMKFIQGETFHAAIQGFHKKPGNDFNSLEFRGLLRRFIDVCNAIGYAHSRGVIHRDLKPDNVMLGEFGETLIVDLGLAKVAGSAESPAGNEDSFLERLRARAAVQGTISAGAVGTFGFMSPEQASGDIAGTGPASDVYSLGATLFMLLTGELSITRGEQDAMIAQVTQGNVRTPESIRPDVPKPLAAICKKAMALRPEDRYGSALAVAGEVEHWLADEPVGAYVEPVLVRVRRWGRKHRTMVTSVMLGLVIAAGALALLTVVLNSKNTALAEANYRESRARESETAAKERAEGNFGMAKEAVERYLGTVTDDEDLKRADFIKLRKKLLETAIPFFERIVEQKSDDPEVEAGRGYAYERLGYLRSGIGEQESAWKNYEVMRQVFEKLAANFPMVPAYRRALALSHDNQGNLLAELGDRAAAQRAHQQALAIREKLVVDFPQNPPYRQAVAMSHNNLGVLFSELGDRAAAREAYQKALAVRETLVADFPTVSSYRQEFAQSHNNLGNLLREQGDRAGARRAYLQALSIQEKLVADFSTVPGYQQELASNHHNLGQLLSESGDPAGALVTSQRALTIQEKLVADFSTVPGYRQQLAGSNNNLGKLLSEQGDRAGARRAYLQALSIQEKLVANFPSVPAYRQELAVSQHNLGVLLNHLGDGAGARRVRQQALTIQEKLVADFPAVPAYRQELASSQLGLGICLSESGDLPGALRACQHALTIQEKLVADFPAVPAYQDGLAASHYALSTLLRAIGDRPGARAATQHAQTIQEKLVADFPAVRAYHRALAMSHNVTSVLLSESNDQAGARKEIQRALTIQEKLVADFPSTPAYRQDLASSHNNLGVLLLKLGDGAGARRAYQQALAIREKLAADFPTVPVYQQHLATSHYTVGDLLRRLGDRGTSREAYQQALAIQEKLVADFPTVPAYRYEMASSHNDLGILLRSLGDEVGARRAYQQALDMRERLAADFPSVLAYALELAGAYVNLGNLSRDEEQLAAALESYDNAIRRLAPVAEGTQVPAQAHLYLRNAYSGRARVLGMLGRHTEAVATWDEALKLENGNRRSLFESNRQRSLLRAATEENPSWPILWSWPRF